MSDDRRDSDEIGADVPVPPDARAAGLDDPTTIDYELDDEVHADTPQQLKAIGDELRSTILDLVLERAMTVTELAERLERPKGTVAYHVDVLVDAGLVKVVRTRKVRAIEERFYGRVARTIVLGGIEGGADHHPFLDDARREIDADALEHLPSVITYRHARIPAERAREFVERLHALAVEFSALPRAGDREYGALLALFPTNRRVAPRPTHPTDPSDTTDPPEDAR